MNRRPLLGCLLLLAAGCAFTANLPEDWKDAEPVPSMSQSECDGDPYESYDEHIEASGGAGQVEIHYQEAHFRCEQEVEAWSLLEGDTLSILVQPIDMNPRNIAMCDCLYDIDITVEGLPAGALTVDLYRRWDEINDPNDPVFIDSAEVEID